MKDLSPYMTPKPTRIMTRFNEDSFGPSTMYTNELFLQLVRALPSYQLLADMVDQYHYSVFCANMSDDYATTKAEIEGAQQRLAQRMKDELNITIDAKEIPY